MATDMTACVLHDHESGPVLLDASIDPPHAGEVRVRLAASGICGSDVHLVHGRSNAAFLPAVMGHEGAGLVDSVGEGVTTISPGDRVIVAMSAPCGTCPRCIGGQMHLCGAPDRIDRIKGRMSDGTSRVHHDGGELYPFVGCGTLAEYLVVPEAQLVPFPDDIAWEVAAITACGVMTGVGAVFNIAGVEPGSTALVVGCGGVGLSVVQGCRVAGAARIIAVDANPDRLPLAAQVGASDTIDVSGADLAEAVRAIVPGGVDYAFEVVGIAELVTTCFGLVRQGGTCVATATYPPGSQLQIGPQDLFWDRRLRGCVAGNSVPRRDLPRILDLYRAGRLDLDALVGSRFHLDEVHEGIAATERGEVGRAVVTFGAA